MNMEEKDMQQNGQNTTDTTGLNINADENAAGTTHLNEPVGNEDEVEKLDEQLKEQKDKYLRLMAEFENFRKRTAKERIELIQTASKDLMVSLLEVLDDMDRAEKQMKTDDDPKHIKQGVQLVFNKLRNILQAKGLKPMESVQTDFDVEKHEAITQIPAATEDLKGKVVDEVQKGYYLNDKIIRFAKVVIGK